MTGTTNDHAKRPRSLSKVRIAKASFKGAPAPVTAEIMPAANILDDAAPAWLSPTLTTDATIDATTATSTDANTLDDPTPPRSLPAMKLISPSPFSTPDVKENIMATAFETTNDTVTETVKATVSQFNDSAEAAMTSGKEAMEKITAQAKDAAENSMKSIEEMTDLARGNVEAMLASARVAAAGFETVAAHISEVSRKSFESTTTAARAMTSAKTPNEMFQLQNDFAKTQFDVAVSEFSKMTEMMVKLSGEVMEPVQNRMAIATDKMKTVFTK